MSKTIELYLKSQELAGACSRKAKEFTNKGKTVAKEAFRKAVHDPRQLLAHLLTFSSTPKLRPTPQRAAHPTPAPSLPVKEKPARRAAASAPLSPAARQMRETTVKQESDRYRRIVGYGARHGLLPVADRLARITDMEAGEAIELLQKCTVATAKDRGARTS